MASKKEQAYQALQNYQAQAPGPYQSPYQSQIDSLMQNLGNRNFSYNYREELQLPGGSDLPAVQATV